ncbi:ribbon-helix-helix protein, CopG family [Gordonia sp. CPCC 205515]|uniref:ribbon-helix-helix protein, CopG family n=1 Tax=Gordonia sp. CPCC 205515 TaxID=3140791 RepID=UPI003AF408DE
MRTTVILPDELYEQVKRSAREADQTVTSLLEDALRRELDRRADVRRDQPAATLPPPYTGRSGIRADLDIAHGQAILAAMEDGLPIEKRR